MRRVPSMGNAFRQSAENAFRWLEVMLRYPNGSASLTEKSTLRIAAARVYHPCDARADSRTSLVIKIAVERETMRARIMIFFAFAVFTATLMLTQSARVKAGQVSDASGASDAAQLIVITPANAIPSNQGPVEHFSGSVRLDMLTEPKEPGKPRVESITFAAGAHTAWHSHPLGQILVVTSGSGFIQQWGRPIQQIHTGDVIWTPANVKHWHGQVRMGR